MSCPKNCPCVDHDRGEVPDESWPAEFGGGTCSAAGVSLSTPGELCAAGAERRNGDHDMSDKPPESKRILAERAAAITIATAYVAHVRPDAKLWVGDPGNPNHNPNWGHCITVTVPVLNESYEIQLHVSMTFLPFTARIESEMLLHSGGDELTDLQRLGPLLTQFAMLSDMMGVES